MDEQINHNSTEVISQLNYELQQKAEFIEVQNQELYSAKNKLDCMNAMKVEMEIEIEALNGLYQINGNLESKIKLQEKEIMRLQMETKNLESQIAEKSSNEITCSELKNQILSLEKELESRKRKELDQLEEILQAGSNTLKEEHNVLLQSMDELKVEKEEYGCRISLLETTLSERNQEIQELKDIIEVKDTDLKSSIQLTKELQEEKLAMTAELMIFKSNKDNHKDRGNSLFSEVEDKRASTAVKLEMLQKKYKDLKMAFIKKNGEIKSLEVENNNLRKQWKEDNNEPYESVATLVENYKTRISELSNLVAELEKRPESPQIISISDLNTTQVNCIRSMVEYERKANRELRAEMQERAARETFLAEQMHDLQRKIKTMKVQMMKNVTVISELRSELEYYKNLNDASTTQGIASLKDVTNHKETKNYSMPIGNAGTKSVRFDETIVETSIVSSTQINDSAVFKKPSIYDNMQSIISTKVGKENNK